MTRMRRAIGRIAVAWLLCQVATLSLASVVLWSGSGAAVLECTCTHGDHAICPMHHKPAPGSKLCLMGSADDNDATILTSVLGSVGVAPARPSALIPADRHVVLLSADTTAHTLRPAPPDPPPPRL